MKTKLLNVVSFILALAGTVLAFADTQQQVEAISPQIAHFWPLIMGAALLVSRITKLIGDYLDDGKLNDSFRAGLLVVLIFLAILFSGCSVTGSVIYPLPEGGKAVVGFTGELPSTRGLKK